MALSLAPLFMGDTLQVFCLSHWKLTNTQAPQLCVFSAWSRLDLGMRALLAALVDEPRHAFHNLHELILPR